MKADEISTCQKLQSAVTLSEISIYWIWIFLCLQDIRKHTLLPDERWREKKLATLYLGSVKISLKKSLFDFYRFLQILFLVFVVIDATQKHNLWKFNCLAITEIQPGRRTDIQRRLRVPFLPYGHGFLKM